MPDRHQTKSKYTADRQIPGAFEGETVTRRRFMTGTVHVAGAVAMSAIALPAVGFALGPIFEKKSVEWHAIGEEADFSAEDYIPKVITETEGTGTIGQTPVKGRARNDEIDPGERDQYTDFIAIATRSRHLVCPVRYPAAAQRFICPCHGGVYDFRGKVDGGPPVRPLDRFYTRVRNGQVEVGPRFSVNSELRRFSPRYPGEDLDGAGQYLYPSRPTQRKLEGT